MGLRYQEKNLDFLESLDEELFIYQTENNLSNLDTVDKMRAALSIRKAYHHGMETLFSIIGASIQAPDCIYAWLAQYNMNDLRCILREMNTKKANFFQKIKFPKPLSWDTYALAVFNNMCNDEGKRNETAKYFAQFWRRLSCDFLDQYSSYEYNSIKHGCRIKNGGFALAVGIEKTKGERVSAKHMKTIGQSEFGTSFYLSETLCGNNLKNSSPNFRTKHMNMNWDVDNTAHALYLIAFSLKNIKSFVKILNGFPPAKVDFSRPKDIAFFDKPWEKGVGVTSMSFDNIVDLSNRKLPTKQELEDHIRKIRQDYKISADLKTNH